MSWDGFFCEEEGDVLKKEMVQTRVRTAAGSGWALTDKPLQGYSDNLDTAGQIN